MLTKVKGGWILGRNDVSEEEDKVRQKDKIRNEPTSVMKYVVSQDCVGPWEEGDGRG